MAILLRPNNQHCVGIGNCILLRLLKAFGLGALAFVIVAGIGVAIEIAAIKCMDACSSGSCEFISVIGIIVGIVFFVVAFVSYFSVYKKIRHCQEGN